MDKQELINNIVGKKFINTYVSGDITADYKKGFNDACDKILSLAKRLDEPQKVKVPEFVAPFIEKLKNTNSRYGVELEKAYHDEENSDLANWLWFNKNTLTLFKALENGYEVEEEPKYYVNIGYLYLKEPLGDTSDFTIGMTWNREYAYPFDSWNMAREHASKLGGTAEKV